MPRLSIHIEPRSPRALARHYIGDLVYGANDGIITTFAVVAGGMGGALSPAAVLIICAANLVADGLSMGVGNYLAIRAHESAREADNLPEEEAYPARHGVATFLAFVVAGSVPALPYLVAPTLPSRDLSAAVLTLTALFAVGAARAIVTAGRWWATGLEMLGLGVVVAAAAYGAGFVAAYFLGSQVSAIGSHSAVSL
jgi:VIT1/CCC1 family predicted Fe2+/Mn2+ transporter